MEYVVKSKDEITAAMQLHIETREQGFSWSLGDFTLGDKLGGGHFGKIYWAQEKRSGYLVALKTLVKSRFVKSSCEKLALREIEIHSHLDHPNIIRLLTYFHDQQRIYLVMELAAGGDLWDEMERQPEGRFSDHLAAKYTYQVADALRYCHANSVIHRDVKPRNILLTDDGDVKLADFGWSVHTPSLKRKTKCGTLYYLAPEMVPKGSRTYNERVDHWSLGITCYEMLVGYPPFFPCVAPDIYERIKTAKVLFPSIVAPKAQELVLRLLRRKPKLRIGLDEVMTHAWVVENKDRN